jgi:hypothetical protein
MLASLVFLTPGAALVALAALLPAAAIAIAERRVAAVRSLLSLRAPRGGLDLVPAAAIAAVVLLLALAAAQPALARRTTQRVRTDAQVVFVFDTSESMGASSGPHGRTRLERATAAAARLRSAIADVPAGVANLTDRVLPNLLPVPDAAAFDATLKRTIGIDEPPPRDLNPRATSFGALSVIPRSGYFEPSAKRRAIVLLTDGESAAFDPAAIARAFAGTPRTSFLAVRFWRGDEAIYGPSGKPDPNYRPDPSSKAQLASLATATHGRLASEGGLGKAAADLRALLGTGPSRPVGRTERTHPLAPWIALVALIPLALVFHARGTRRR